MFCSTFLHIIIADLVHFSKYMYIVYTCIKAMLLIHTFVKLRIVNFIEEFSNTHSKSVH